MVKKYRKKPVEIQAMLWDGNNHREMFDFLEGEEASNKYMDSVGKNFYIDYKKVDGGLVIKTLEGEHIAYIGDYIIKGINGEFYFRSPTHRLWRGWVVHPCKPDVFEKSYDLISE